MSRTIEYDMSFDTENIVGEYLACDTPGLFFQIGRAHRGIVDRAPSKDRSYAISRRARHGSKPYLSEYVRSTPNHKSR